MLWCIDPLEALDEATGFGQETLRIGTKADGC
jgi:hypothetical protein